jgi:ribosome-associated toxin RatA of RatAB toxin-antitoxin module
MGKTMRLAIFISALFSLIAISTFHDISTAQASSPDVKTSGLSNSDIQVTSIPQTGSSIQSGRAETIVDAHFDRVMQIVEDYGNYAGFLPHFRVSRVLTQHGANAIVYIEATIIKDTFKIWAQAQFRSRPPQGKTQIIEGKMTKGNVKSLSARWEVTPLDDGRTNVVFQVFFDPDLPLPSSLVTDQNTNAAKKTIKALRKLIQQG